MSQWYRQTVEGELGPLSFQQLVEMVLAGSLMQDDLVRADYEKTWRRADQVVGLYYMARRATWLAQAPPPSEYIQSSNTANNAADVEACCLLVRSAETFELVQTRTGTLQEVPGCLSLSASCNVRQFGERSRAIRIVVGAVTLMRNGVCHLVFGVTQFLVLLGKSGMLGIQNGTAVSNAKHFKISNPDENEADSRCYEIGENDSLDLIAQVDHYRMMPLSGGPSETEACLAEGDTAVSRVKNERATLEADYHEAIVQAAASFEGISSGFECEPPREGEVVHEAWENVVAQAVAQYDARHEAYKRLQHPKRGIRYWCGWIVVALFYLVLRAVRCVLQMLWMPFALIAHHGSLQLDDAFQATYRGWWGKVIRVVESFCNRLGLGDEALRWIFVLFWTVAAANGMALALMFWTENEDLRFPARMSAPEQKSFPILGQCEPAEYWILYGHAVAISGAASFAITYWLANKAE